MEFHVYVLIGKKLIFAGQTKYISDARSILKNWDAGYIVQDGEIIQKKNWAAVKKVSKI